jgi:hypothetical protein
MSACVDSGSWAAGIIVSIYCFGMLEGSLNPKTVTRITDDDTEAFSW